MKDNRYKGTYIPPTKSKSELSVGQKKEYTKKQIMALIGNRFSAKDFASDDPDFSPKLPSGTSGAQHGRLMNALSFRPRPEVVRNLLVYNEVAMNFSRMILRGNLDSAYTDGKDLSLVLVPWKFNEASMPLFGINVSKLRLAYIYFFGEIPMGCRVSRIVDTFGFHPRNLILSTNTGNSITHKSIIKSYRVGTFYERHVVKVQRQIGRRQTLQKVAEAKTWEEAVQAYRVLANSGGIIGSYHNYQRYATNRFYCNGEEKHLFPET